MKRSLFLAAVAVGLAGCSPGVSVEISARESSVPRSGKVDIAVQVRNPPPGVMYRWWAELGRFDPQETAEPGTTYFAPDARISQGIDRVRVEVILGTRVIATRAIDIRISDEPQGGRGSNIDSGPARIAIGRVPRYEPVGGPETSAEIAGSVSGVVPEGSRIVLYAMTDRWYVQPLIAAPFTSIGSDGSWRTWTHTGARYAALLVRPGFAPPPTLTDLLKPGGEVVAVVVVEGEGAPASIPAGANSAPAAAPPFQAAEAGAPARVAITVVPPWSAGGDATMARIQGVSGNAAPACGAGGCRIVIYALASNGAWYVQPFVSAPFTTIGPSGQWATDIHLGTEYAALLVPSSYRPSSTLSALPAPGGAVLALTREAGKR